MPSVFTLIGESWAFARKQPVLLHIGFWLLFLPMLVMNELSAYLQVAEKTVNTGTAGPVIFSILAILALSVFSIWGTAAVLLTGSRLLAAKSGRSRTSFKAVRTEASAFIIPLLLTKILRGIFSALWGILLIIPGILYFLNTLFYAVVIVVEGISYRAALRKSNAIMKGQRVAIYLRIIFLSILLFAPVSILSALLNAIPVAGSGLLIDIIVSAFYTLAFVLFHISCILFYGALRPATAPITGTGGTKKKTVKSAKK
jgi:uncharacterized membrane protein